MSLGAGAASCLEDETSCPRRKLLAASIVARTPMTRIMRLLEQTVPFTRVVVYHGTPARLRASLARQFDYLFERYRGVSACDLENTLREGPGAKPAVLFTFDDGLANNYEVAAPLLEERGVRGIFCVPADFLSVPREEQPRWFIQNVRAASDREHCTDEDRMAMTWEQARELARRGHRICSHSQTHHRICADTPASALQVEIVESRQAISRRLEHHEVDGFCWPVLPDQLALAAKELMRANYRYVLAGGSGPLFRGHDRYSIYRTNLEASWPPEVVDLQLSGIVDLVFRMRALIERVSRRKLHREYEG